MVIIKEECIITLGMYCYRATSAVGRRLACIGDEIEAKYGQEFTKFGKALNIQQGALDQAYEAFRGVAIKYVISVP